MIDYIQYLQGIYYREVPDSFPYTFRTVMIPVSNKVYDTVETSYYFYLFVVYLIGRKTMVVSTRRFSTPERDYPQCFGYALWFFLTVCDVQNKLAVT